MVGKNENCQVHIAYALWICQILVVRAQLRSDKRGHGDRSRIPLLRVVLGFFLSHSLPMLGGFRRRLLSNFFVPFGLWITMLSQVQLLDIPFMAAISTYVHWS